MEWETVIGLEVHAQLATASKIFSGASTAFGADPNTQACAIDLAFPGVLPVLNAEVVNMAIKLGLGINASIVKRSVFARKNYFILICLKATKLVNLNCLLSAKVTWIFL